MEKMGLIVFAKTGHVLGAFTRQGDPEGALDPEAVAGGGLRVRNQETGAGFLTVEPRHLTVEIVDRFDRVLLDWQRYVVEDKVPDDTGKDVTSVTLDGTEVEVELPADATEDLEAWVQVEGGPTNERIVQKVMIPSGTGSSSPATDPLPLSAGEYLVLVLVPGHRAEITRITVP